MSQFSLPFEGPVVLTVFVEGFWITEDSHAALVVGGVGVTMFLHKVAVAGISGDALPLVDEIDMAVSVNECMVVVSTSGQQVSGPCFIGLVKARRLLRTVPL